MTVDAWNVPEKRETITGPLFTALVVVNEALPEVDVQIWGEIKQLETKRMVWADALS